jgi:RNA polymerase sigma factor (sigma-70 family)
MQTMALAQVVQRLRHAAQRCDMDALSDAQLLECFLADGHEAAFGALVRRHAAMVFGVCRRVLGHHQDAEDAFQATFLVLARKAAAVQPPGMVGNWLHGVAYQTALKARAGVHKRRTWELPLAADIPEPAGERRRDLQAVLDQELSRLPDRYRVALVLCDLEGHTRKAAAELLGWREGTVSSRLARARALLAKRLTRHGLLFSGGLLATALAAQGASAAPLALVSATVTVGLAFAAGPGTAATGAIPASVAALTEGVLQAMWLTKLKFAALVIVLVAALVGLTGVLDFENTPAHAATIPAAPADGLVLQKKPGEPAAVEIHGVVRAIDGKKITLAVAPAKKGDPAEERTFELAKAVKVQIDLGKSSKPDAFRPGAVADVKVAMMVVGVLSADGNQVNDLRLLGITVGGVLKSVDPATNTITVTHKHKGGDDHNTVYPIARDARVAIEQRDAPLKDLTADMLVTLRLSGDQKEAGTVSALWPSIQAVFRAVDVQKGTITLNVPTKGDPDAEVSYPLAQDVAVVVYGREAKLKDLPKDVTVSIKLVGSKQEAGIIHVSGPTVTGVLKSVDATRNSVTVAFFSKFKGAAEERTFTLVKNTPIGLPDGKTGALADLAKDRPVTLWLSTDLAQVVGVLQGKKGK